MSAIEPTLLPLDALEAELRVPPRGATGPGWLDASRADPGFWPALLRTQAALLASPAKSAIGHGYDPFHDALLRHAGRGALALGWREGGGWREVDFEALAAWAGERARAWRRAGAVAGQSVAVVRPFGPEAAASLLAAWKLGAVPCLVPARALAGVEARLAALVPEHVDCAPEVVPFLGAFRPRRFPPPPSAGEEGPAEPEGRALSFSYRPEMPALRAFDLAGGTPDLPVEVTAEALYLAAVRDGLLGLGLRPGAGALAAALPALAAQPSLLLACLLSGAPYLHLDAADVERDPALLGERKVRALVVGVPAREALLLRPVSLRGCCDAWFRDAAESSDAGSWTAFAAASGLDGTAAGTLRWSAPVGGLALFSRSARAADVHAVYAPPGVAAEVVAPGPAASAGELAVTPPRGDAPRTTGNLVVRLGGRFVFAGSVHAGRRGETYPRRAVLAAASAAAQGALPSLCELPAAGGTTFELLLFTGAQQVDRAALEARVVGAIRERVGAEWLPERVVVVALLPRWKDGAVDHAWCQEQHATGALARRARSPVQAAATRLRAALGRSR